MRVVRIILGWLWLAAVSAATASIPSSTTSIDHFLSVFDYATPPAKTVVRSLQESETIHAPELKLQVVEWCLVTTGTDGNPVLGLEEGMFSDPYGLCPTGNGGLGRTTGGIAGWGVDQVNNMGWDLLAMGTSIAGDLTSALGSTVGMFSRDAQNTLNGWASNLNRLSREYSDQRNGFAQMGAYDPNDSFTKAATLTIGLGMMFVNPENVVAEIGAVKTEMQLPGNLYHYTGAGNVESILQNGLGVSGRRTFATPLGNLSPVQAQIELALPANRGYPGALFEINTSRLQQLGINPSVGPQRIMSTPNAGGGGIEYIFNQPIPPSAIRQVTFP